LCYTPCNDGYSGNGPICWSDCPSNYPYSCGEVFCAVTSRECTSELAKLTSAGLSISVAAGIATIVIFFCLIERKNIIRSFNNIFFYEKFINFKLFKATDLSLFFSGVGFVGSIFGLTSGLVVPQCSLNTTSL